MKRLVLTIAILLGLAAPAWAGFAEGFAAYERGDYVTALRELQPLAHFGHAAAQRLLGDMYRNGRGVPQDVAEAANWYRKAAEQGDVFAQFTLAVWYEIGIGVTQDYAEAVKWYRKPAEQGRIVAQANLGVMYDKGQGVPQDYIEAVKWYRKAAEQGNANAQANLGTMYRKGRGVPQDSVRAHMWFNLAASRLPLGPDRDEAVKNRDIAAEHLNRVQIAEAQRLAREWKPKKEGK